MKQKTKEKMIELRKSGYTLKEIANRVGYSISTVFYHLKDKKVKYKTINIINILSYFKRDKYKWDKICDKARLPRTDFLIKYGINYKQFERLMWYV